MEIRTPIRKLSLLPHDVLAGARIGGNPPSGQEIQLSDEHCQYFGTFPLFDHPGMEFSVFHRFDTSRRIDDIDWKRDIITFNDQVLEPGYLMWATVHETSQRSPTGPPNFTANGLLIGEPEADYPEVSGEELDAQRASGKPFLEYFLLPWQRNTDFVYGYSKIGGLPFHISDAMWFAYPEFAAKGYQMLLQIDDMGNLEDFPWDPGMLQVYSRDQLDADSYRFIIQQ